jgi:hypothetical protein
MMCCSSCFFSSLNWSLRALQFQAQHRQQQQQQQHNRQTKSQFDLVILMTPSSAACSATVRLFDFNM